MNRLHKKCFFMSAGIHLLLAALLFVGPGFLGANSREEMIQVIDFVPEKLVAEAVAGGGNPNAAAVQAPPQPVAPPPTPPPVRNVAPEPEPEPDPEPPRKSREPERKQAEPDPASVEPAQKLPKVSTVVKRSTKATNARKLADARQRQVNEARQRLAGQLSGAASRIGSKTGSATVVEQYGPGGGGPTYAGYVMEVQRVYFNAWAPPEDTARDNAVVRARVTIARDGRVTSAVPLDFSGDAQVDESVRMTLNRVRFIAPFPEGSKDKEVTYIIKFDLKVKRGLA